MTTYDFAIIGGGPAGSSAALFLARAKYTTLVVDEDKGLTRRAMVHNHLGVPAGISGPDLVEAGHAQAQKAGATLVKTKVASVTKKGADGFTLALDGGAQHEAKQVILCLGVNLDVAKALGIAAKPGSEPYIKEVLVVESDGKTSVPGVWAAGVCAGVSVHTIVTAGDGARVACNAIAALKGARWADHDVLK